MLAFIYKDLKQKQKQRNLKYILALSQMDFRLSLAVSCNLKLSLIRGFLGQWNCKYYNCEYLLLHIC